MRNSYFIFTYENTYEYNLTFVSKGLIVVGSKILDTGGVGEQMFIYISGIASLTLIVNATLSNAVLQYLKLVEVSTNISEEKTMILDFIRRELRNRMVTKLEKELSKELGIYVVKLFVIILNYKSLITINTFKGLMIKLKLKDCAACCNLKMTENPLLDVKVFTIQIFTQQIMSLSARTD